MPNQSDIDSCVTVMSNQGLRNMEASKAGNETIIWGGGDFSLSNVTMNISCVALDKQNCIDTFQCI